MRAAVPSLVSPAGSLPIFTWPRSASKVIAYRPVSQAAPSPTSRCCAMEYAVWVRASFTFRGALALCLPLVACTAADPPPYTQFSVPIDTSGGGLQVQVSAGAGPTLTASVDTFSPFTIIDRSTPGEPAGEVKREVVNVAILAQNNDGEFATRARFTGVEALASHPCQNSPEDVVNEACLIGLSGNTRAIDAILGADVLSRNAVRIDFTADTMSFFPDIAGDAGERGAMCDAVIGQPFQGGGTVVIGGAEVSIPARRIAIDGCFFVDPCDGTEGGDGCDAFCGAPQPMGTQQGVASLFVISTGLAITIVNRTTYDRYRYMHELNGTDPLPPDLGSSPPAAEEATLYLPSGPIAGYRVTMTDLALVAESSDERGPCDERYANDYLSRRSVCETPGSVDCPCADGNDFCRASAVAELSGATADFDVLVVSDNEQTLQALRNELRPESPEVSGILGVNALEALEIDIDYPNNRLLLRCSDSNGCTIRPQVLSQSNLELTRDCLPDSLLDCI